MIEWDELLAAFARCEGAGVYAGRVVAHRYFVWTDPGVSYA